MSPAWIAMSDAFWDLDFGGLTNDAGPPAGEYDALVSRALHLKSIGRSSEDVASAILQILTIEWGIEVLEDDPQRLADAIEIAWRAADPRG
jgi:hypothetical protein